MNECLNRDEIGTLLRDRPESEAVAQFRQHAAGCPTCGSLLQEIASLMLVEEVALSDHLNYEELADYQNGRLAPSKSLIVRLHLDGCTDCRQRLSALEHDRAEALELPAVVFAPPEPHRARWRWGMMGLGVAAAAALALVVFWPRPAVRQVAIAPLPPVPRARPTPTARIAQVRPMPPPVPLPSPRVAPSLPPLARQLLAKALTVAGPRAQPLAFVGGSGPVRGDGENATLPEIALDSPLNEAVLATPIVLRWERPERQDAPITYDVEIDGEPQKDSLSATQIVVGNIAPGRHAWKVTAHNADGDLVAASRSPEFFVPDAAARKLLTSTRDPLVRGAYFESVGALRQARHEYERAGNARLVRRVRSRGALP